MAGDDLDALRRRADGLAAQTRLIIEPVPARGRLRAPRDLRFQRIVDFKKKLRERADATMKPGHTTYLKSFGTFKVAKIETSRRGSPHSYLFPYPPRVDTVTSPAGR